MPSIPAVLSQLIDRSPDAKTEIKEFKANDVSYLLVTQACDQEGGQILVKLNADRSSAEVLAADAVVDLTAFDFGAQPASEAPLQDTNGRIHSAAVAQVDQLSSANAHGTDGGRLACVWSVRQVVRIATGVDPYNGLDTSGFADALRAGRGRRIVDLAQLAPGHLIISPTDFSVLPVNHGHVGIVGAQQATGDWLIYSNASAEAMWKQNYTLASWRARYVDQKHLDLQVYEIVVS